MSPTQLHDFLVIAIQHKLSVLIKGAPGIGKSDIVAQACATAGAHCLLMHPAISDPTDFKGLPARISDTEAHFLPFGDLLKLIHATEPTVCFQDDIGQAAPSVQAALMQLNLARAVNGLAISPHVIFIGATNDVGQMAGVSGMIEPLKSRWHTIVNLVPDAPAWLTWATANAMPDVLTDFIRAFPQHLSAFKPTKQITNSPSPRGWAAVGRWLNASVADVEVFAGAIGEGVAVEFCAYLDMRDKIPTTEKVLSRPTTIKIPANPSVRIALCSSLAHKVKVEELPALFQFLDRLSADEAVACVKHMLELRPDLKDNSSMQTFVAAHHASF